MYKFIYRNKEKNLADGEIKSVKDEDGVLDLLKIDVITRVYS